MVWTEFTLFEVLIADGANLVADLQARNAMIFGWLALGFSVISSLGLGFYLANLINQPVSQMADRINIITSKDFVDLKQVFQQPARGDLTGRFNTVAEPISINTKDEIGLMAAMFNPMVEQLHSIKASYDEMMQNPRRLGRGRRASQR